MMIRTLTTAITVVSETTRPSPTHWLMSNFDWALPMLRSSLLIDEKTPIASSTDQSTTDAVTRTMPRATDSRNDNLSTDHGSTRATVSRTLRGPTVAIPPVDGPWTWRGGSAYTLGRGVPRPFPFTVAVGAGAGAASEGAPSPGRPPTLGAEPDRNACSD